MVKAAMLVTTIPGKVDDAVKSIDALGVKDVLSVTGPVDVVVFMKGSREDILGKIKEIFEIEEVETTETLWEVEG